MITRAKVIKKLDTQGYKWAVNIPILNGIPDSEEEYNQYKNLLNVAIENNSKLPIEQQKSKQQVADVVSQEWKSKNNILLDSRYDKINDGTFNNTLSEFTMEASICGVPGIQNYINVGDIVYVGFEDNDMGKPIILGHLLTSYLEEKRNCYPGLKLSSLDVQDSAILSSKTQLDSFNLNQKIQELIQFKNTYSDGLATLISKLNPISILVENLDNLLSILGLMTINENSTIEVFKDTSNEDEEKNT